MPRTPYWTAEGAAAMLPYIAKAHDQVFAPSTSTTHENEAKAFVSASPMLMYRVYLRTDATYVFGMQGTYTLDSQLYDEEGYPYLMSAASNYESKIDKSGYYYVSIWWKYLPASTPGSINLTFTEDIGGDDKNATPMAATAVSVAWANLLRAPGDANLQALAAAADAGTITKAQAIAQIADRADTTTSVATLSYQFFTGKIPSQGGIDYLVDPKGSNSNTLNSAYYQSFNLENRYINFAVNLGKVGEGASKFISDYGKLSLFDATRKAYATIFGGTPTDEKIHALIDSRTDYFAAYGGDGANGQGTKAAMVGWLLAEAMKAGVGMYARANDAFLLDLADGASFAIDLVGTYGKPEFVYGG